MLFNIRVAAFPAVSTVALIFPFKKIRNPRKLEIFFSIFLHCLSHISIIQIRIHITNAHIYFPFFLSLSEPCIPSGRSERYFWLKKYLCIKKNKKKPHNEMPKTHIYIYVRIQLDVYAKVLVFFPPYPRIWLSFLFFFLLLYDLRLQVMSLLPQHFHNGSDGIYYYHYYSTYVYIK